MLPEQVPGLSLLREVTGDVTHFREKYGPEEGTEELTYSPLLFCYAKRERLITIQTLPNFSR